MIEQSLLDMFRIPDGVALQAFALFARSRDLPSVAGIKRILLVDGILFKENGKLQERGWRLNMANSRPAPRRHGIVHDEKLKKGLNADHVCCRQLLPAAIV